MSEEENRGFGNEGTPRLEPEPSEKSTAADAASDYEMNQRLEPETNFSGSILHDDTVNSTVEDRAPHLEGTAMQENENEAQSTGNTMQNYAETPTDFTIQRDGTKQPTDFTAQHDSTAQPADSLGQSAPVQSTGFTMRDSDSNIANEASHSYQERRRADFEGMPKQERNYDSYRISSPVPPVSPQRPKKPANGFWKKIGMCAVCAIVFGLIAGVVFQMVNLIGNQMNGSSNQAENTKQLEKTEIPNTAVNTNKEDNTDIGGRTVSTVAKSAMPSVVAITNISVQEIPNYFGFGKQEIPNESSGSGIIVGQNETELLIATNNHVVSGATTLTVLFAGQENSSQDEAEEKDGTNAVEAQIKGTDPDNDLAVIAVKTQNIPADVLEQVKICQIGDSQMLEVGEQVVAIGNALGYGQSVTSGYVSALNRKVTVDNVTSTLIQTDAAINPGNSGGALLNMNGELIGINAVKFASSEVEGMGYAIPIATAEPILNELMSRETRYKVEDEQASYMGISCKNVTAEISQMYDMPVGVLVYEVTQGGPADSAGIQKRDVITKLDGQSVNTAEELIESLTYYAAGETIELELSRADGSGEYKTKTFSVTLGNKKDMPKE